MANQILVLLLVLFLFHSAQAEPNRFEDTVFYEKSVEVISFPTIPFATLVRPRSYLMVVEEIEDICKTRDQILNGILNSINTNNKVDYMHYTCDKNLNGSLAHIPSGEQDIGLLTVRKINNKMASTQVMEHEMYHALRKLGVDSEISRFHRTVKTLTDGKINLDDFDEETAAWHVSVLSYLLNGVDISSLSGTNTDFNRALKNYTGIELNAEAIFMEWSYFQKDKVKNLYQNNPARYKVLTDLKMIYECNLVKLLDDGRNQSVIDAYLTGSMAKYLKELNVADEPCLIGIKDVLNF